MKNKRSLLIAILGLSGQLAWAQTPARDPIGENFFPPELVMQHREAIGLSDDQTDTIRAELEKAHSRFQELHERMQKQVEALGALVREERVAEPAALAQLDKVLNAERDIKRAHLALMIGLKNKLTAEQQAKLREIRQKLGDSPAPPAGPPPAIVAKMEKLQAGIKKWEQDGRDPASVGETMQEFEPLMKQGKIKEAEQVLDRALKLLEDGQKK